MDRCMNHLCCDKRPQRHRGWTSHIRWYLREITTWGITLLPWCIYDFSKHLRTKKKAGRYRVMGWKGPGRGGGPCRHISRQFYRSYLHSDHHSLCTRPCTCRHMNLVCWCSWRWRHTGWFYRIRWYLKSYKHQQESAYHMSWRTIQLSSYIPDRCTCC